MVTIKKYIKLYLVQFVFKIKFILEILFILNKQIFQIQKYLVKFLFEIQFIEILFWKKKKKKHNKNCKKNI